MTDVQQQEKATITLDGETYIVDDLSESSRYCLGQLQDLQTQIVAARAKVDQLVMAERGFLDLLREEVKKPAEEPAAE